MEKIIITIKTPAFSIEAISRALAAAAKIEIASQEIYLKTMRGFISVCLS